MRKLIADNKRARFDYYIEHTYEAGLVLTGTEVKSLRLGRANIGESYASPENNEVWLINSYVPEYGPASRFNHEPRRKRKLLLRAREVNQLYAAVNREGRTIVPLKLYFNERGLVKLELALAKGKKDHDKRDTTKEREWKREQGRLMRDRG
ncbi:SsrA-binding protein SmpB [Candidatus Phycosocius spiralis]|uniref:SsrA-binding protein SmpB n=1 Tax=Candidatus Phycosocius spiralis TaxID=2815099 RepID=UPI0024E0880A|nr:SsrA-binding protein SmpB [Candidatus Phycosocius spiralis]